MCHTQKYSTIVTESASRLDQRPSVIHAEFSTLYQGSGPSRNCIGQTVQYGKRIICGVGTSLISRSTVSQQVSFWAVQAKGAIRIGARLLSSHSQRSLLLHCHTYSLAGITLLARDWIGPRLCAQLLHYRMLDDRHNKVSGNQFWDEGNWTGRADIEVLNFLLEEKRKTYDVTIFASPTQAKEPSRNHLSLDT